MSHVPVSGGSGKRSHRPRVHRREGCSTVFSSFVSSTGSPLLCAACRRSQRSSALLYAVRADIVGAVTAAVKSPEQTFRGVPARKRFATVSVVDICPFSFSFSFVVTDFLRISCLHFSVSHEENIPQSRSKSHLFQQL